MTTIFLGEPPADIKKWIEDHHGPIVKPETHIKFVDGTEDDYLIEGVMDCPALIAAGLMPPGSGTEMEPSWIKQPLEANIGSAVTSIGDSAFHNCTRLTSVSTPGSVVDIGYMAFSSCSGLTSVTIMDGMETLASHAFSGCTGLTNVTIPNSMTTIWQDAFNYCIGLTNVTFLGKNKTIVQGMDNYSYWGLPSGCILHCTDGDITI